MRTQGWFHTAVVAALVAAGCSRPSTDEVASAIQQKLAGEQGPSKADLQKLYSAHTGPLWVMGSRVDPHAALEVIRSASDHGLNPDDYGARDIAGELRALDEADGRTPERLALVDVLVTGALLQLGHDVAFGRVRPEQVNPQWQGGREPGDLTASLANAASAGDLAAWLDRIKPQHPHYAALQAELRRLRDTSAGDPAAGAHARTIALNLERWRWLPADLGSPHVLVNIPAYRLTVEDGNVPVMRMRVVVGEPDKQTPVFSGTMSTVVFSPYWNIPDSIIEGEIADVAARDPGYLKRNNIDILRVSKSGVEQIDPQRVDWDDAEALKSLAFRQRPGERNALGHVKFLFPNKYNVYLHDTPADALFARRERALSHGCVRLEKPEDLAAFVLRGEERWDRPRIREAMFSGEEQQVALDASMPVHLTYFTAWVDETGHVQYSPDIYEADAAQLNLGR